MADLKPCPFCGGTDLDGGGIVVCNGCGQDVYGNLWNARPIEDALRAERDALVDILADAFGWEDRSYAHAVMHADHAVKNLRAEVAKYRGMEVENAGLRTDNEALRDQVAALKAEIADLKCDSIVARLRAQAAEYGDLASSNGYEFAWGEVKAITDPEDYWT